MRAWMAILVGFVAAPAIAADQFDLACRVGNTPIRYRIDLARGNACEGGCERIWEMGPSTAGEIRLKDTTQNRDEIAQTVTINRQTGAWRHWIAGVGVEEGICEVAAFSGFPQTKF